MARAPSKTKILRGVWIIRAYLRPYRTTLTFIVVFSIVAAAVDALIPLLAGRIIDSLISPGRTVEIGAFAPPLTVGLILLWLIARLVGDIASWQKAARQERLSAIFHADYLVQAFSRILEFPLSFHKRYRLGEVVERLHRGANWIDQIVSRILIEFLPDFMSIVLAFGLAFSIEPRLAPVLVVAVALYSILLWRTTPRLGELSFRMNKAYTQAFGYASDLILNVQAVKQATAEPRERRELFKFFQSRAAGLWTKYMRIWERLNFAQRIIITATQVTIFLFSFSLIQQGALTVGELVAFNAYAALVFGPFTFLTRNWDTIQIGFSAIDRAERLLGRAPERYEPASAVVLKDIQGEVTFKSVSFSYGRGRAKVLDSVSFVVSAGSVVALVGESGVGKSTLVDLVSGYYQPTGGAVRVDGHDVKTLDLRKLRGRIAVVPQEVILFNDTVGANIRYGRFGASERDVREAAQKAHADEFIGRFSKKYDQLVGERGIKLSVGQKQRIAIARAILRDPRILILDEPTSALDAKSEAVIQQSLTELMAGRTTFIIAHRLSTVRRADIILVLDKGKIVERGKHEELIQITDGVYRKLYELQIGLK